MGRAALIMSALTCKSLSAGFRKCYLNLPEENVKLVYVESSNNRHMLYKIKNVCTKKSVLSRTCCDQLGVLWGGAPSGGRSGKRVLNLLQNQ